jgi:hypothetical protein
MSQFFRNAVRSCTSRRTRDAATKIKQLRSSLTRALVSTVRLEERFGDRQAGDSYRLASKRFQAVLEVEIKGWPAASAREHPQTRHPDGAGESDLGAGSRGPSAARRMNWA